jgi:hypothetical protein
MPKEESAQQELLLSYPELISGLKEQVGLSFI